MCPQIGSANCRTSSSTTSFTTSFTTSLPLALLLDWECELPQLFLCEPFLDDNTPFRKFNNNDFIPGQQVCLKAS